MEYLEAKTSGPMADSWRVGGRSGGHWTPAVRHVTNYKPISYHQIGTLPLYLVKRVGIKKHTQTLRRIEN